MRENMKNQLSEYIKFDGEDENLVVSLYSAAVEKAEKETGKVFVIEEDEPESQLYWLAIEMIVAHWYDNRGAVTEKPMNDIPMSAKELLSFIALSDSFQEKEVEV